MLFPSLSPEAGDLTRKLCPVWNGLCPRWGLGAPLHVWPDLVATVATVREPQGALQHEAAYSNRAVPRVSGIRSCLLN